MHLSSITKTLKTALIFSLFFFCAQAGATITFSGSGYSNVVTSGSSITYYVSNIGPGYTFSTSCSTTINPNCKNPGNSLSLSVSSTASVSGTPTLYWIIGSVPTSGAAIAASILVTSAAYSGGATVSMASTYSNICTKGVAAGSQVNIGDADCQMTSGSAQMVLLLDANGNGTYDSGDDIQTFTLKFQNSIPQTTSGSVGLYSFTVFPGDGEFLIKEPHFDGNYPGENNGIQYVNFYSAQTAEGSEGTTLTNLLAAATAAPASTSHSQIGVSDTTGNLSDYYVGGFQNNTKYCLISSLTDNAGNYGYLLNVTGTAAEASSYCNTPSEIAGLLSKNGQCFIATAAYGSALSKHVITLRKFRDQFLIPTKWGRKFVSWYYKNSPPWAEKLRNTPQAKPFVRAMLWPAAFFSSVAVSQGLAIAIVFLLAPVALILTLIALRKKAAKYLVLIFIFGHLALPAFSSAAQNTKQPPLLIKNSTNLPTADDNESTDEDEPANTAESSAEKDQDAGVEYNSDQEIKYDSPPAEEVKADPEAINATTAKEGVRHQKSFDDGGPRVKIQPFANQTGQGQLKKKFKDGTYLYKTKPSPQKFSGGLKMGSFTPADLHGDNHNITYKQIYGSVNPVTVSVDFEWQFFKKAGKLGLQGGVGFFTASGKGRFLNPNLSSTPSETIITLYCFPLQANLLYHAQFSDKQIVVPFGGGGLDYFGMIESRDDRDSLKEKLKFGGAAAAHWVAGLQIMLDALDRDLLWSIDHDYGINHVYLTASVRQVFGLSSIFDFSGMSYEGGVLFEF